LHAANTQGGETILKPFGTHHTSMRQNSVITEIDAKAAEYKKPGNHDLHTRPAKQPGQQGQQCQQMKNDDRECVRPFYFSKEHANRKRQGIFHFYRHIALADHYTVVDSIMPAWSVNITGERHACVNTLRSKNKQVTRHS